MKLSSSTGTVLKELKKLKVSTRNKVRALSSAKDKESVKIFNGIRKKGSVQEIVQSEITIRAILKDNSVIPETFPIETQTKDNYLRVATLKLSKQLAILDCLVGREYEKLSGFLNDLSELNSSIILGRSVDADNIFKKIIDDYGYSHLLLRKSVLFRSANETRSEIIEGFLEDCGLRDNNNIVTSLIHCYKESQDFLGMKRSILNNRNNEEWNKYSKDILRIAFHPHAKNKSELSSLILSCLQSSLIDAIVISKVNSRLFDVEKYPNLSLAFDALERASLGADRIVELYESFDDAEDLFYHQSSAWFENGDVISYRQLQDHFYDAPESYYLDLNEDLVSSIESWVAVDKIGDLISAKDLTKHSICGLKKIEESGLITRSSILNFLIYKAEGACYISESDLLELMGKTSALARTLHVKYAKNLAAGLDSDLARIIIYLLVAKRSRSELDNHKLCSSLQRFVIKNNDRSLLKFFEYLAERNMHVAQYTYEVCNEDFISTLTRLIKSSLMITETRADLHKWMGDVTGDPAYHDRARSLLIDHQINLVRDEIDDNRIYVDTIRFTEWLADEVGQELSSLLLVMEHNNELMSGNEPQLISIIERCYSEFNSNRYFGIASYLGRRIRHGTFKGHLYSDVISIEEGSEFLTSDYINKAKWDNWKKSYEEKIDSIIVDKLHVESSQKKEGFLRPNIRDIKKQEILLACMADMLRDFGENQQINNTYQLIVEYCWRLAEVDLKSINSYLKNRKQQLISFEELAPSRGGLYGYELMLYRDFTRELQKRISEKFSIMYGWFKRPQSISPKASLGLLFKAVVVEVQQTFKKFNPATDFTEDADIELIGGAYHLLYDALYVVVYNAAKHGKVNGYFDHDFRIDYESSVKALRCKIVSENSDGHSDEYIRSKIQVSPDEDIDNAQTDEGRSGIRKLYNLERYDNSFNIDQIDCVDGNVVIQFSYRLVH